VRRPSGDVSPLVNLLGRSLAPGAAQALRFESAR
jgi:hypothetical protein